MGSRAAHTKLEAARAAATTKPPARIRRPFAAIDEDCVLDRC
jgi:hypothetical protein